MAAVLWCPVPTGAGGVVCRVAGLDACPIVDPAADTDADIESGICIGRAADVNGGREVGVGFIEIVGVAWGSVREPYPLSPYFGVTTSFEAVPFTRLVVPWRGGEVGNDPVVPG